MRVIRHTFEEVAVYGRKYGHCVICGKTVERTKKFSQTLNPFNKNSLGQVKSREEIRVELIAEMALWKKGSIKHVKCES